MRPCSLSPRPRASIAPPGGGRGLHTSRRPAHVPVRGGGGQAFSLVMTRRIKARPQPGSRPDGAPGPRVHSLDCAMMSKIGAEQTRPQSGE